MKKTKIRNNHFKSKRTRAQKLILQPTYINNSINHFGLLIWGILMVRDKHWGLFYTVLVIGAFNQFKYGLPMIAFIVIHLMLWLFNNRSLFNITIFLTIRFYRACFFIHTILIQYYILITKYVIMNIIFFYETELFNYEQSMCRFAQIFVLSAQSTKNYYVYNKICNVVWERCKWKWNGNIEQAPTDTGS